MMISRHLLTVGVLTLVLVALAGPSAGAQVMPAASGASLALNPSNRSVWIEDMFTLDIVANTGTGDADTVDAYIDFDPAYLEVVDASGTPTTTIEVNIEIFDFITFSAADNAAGQINFSATRLGSPLAGSFRAATIRFKAKEAVDAATITFVRSGARVSDLYQGGEPFHVALTNGTVTVTCLDFVNPPVGVGVEELQAVAGRWRQTAGLPHDLDGDNRITIIDIMHVAAAWDSTCP